MAASAPLPLFHHPIKCIALWVVLLGIVQGCTRIPELEATIPEHLSNAKYPKLVELDDGLFDVPLPGDAARPIGTTLEGRREQLLARAAGLDGEIVDPDTRTRMKDGVARNATR